MQTWNMINQYQLFINELKNKNIDALYGSRVLKKKSFQIFKNFSHKIRIWGNIFLTLISNFLIIKISLMHTLVINL